MALSRKLRVDFIFAVVAKSWAKFASEVADRFLFVAARPRNALESELFAIWPTFCNFCENRFRSFRP